MDITSLEREIETLRETIRDTEEVCRAIRSGEVDAVVVGPTDDEKRVLLLSGAYARYRQLVEDMQQGAVTISSSGDILFANHSFAAMLGQPLIDLFRTPLLDYVSPAHRQQARKLLAPPASQRDLDISFIHSKGGTRNVRLSLVSASDELVTLLVTQLSESRDAAGEAEATLQAIRDGKVDAFVVKGTEVKILDSAQTPYRALVERMRQGAATVTADGTIVYVNERFASMAALPHGRLMGTPLYNVIAESDRQTFQSMLDAKEASQGELRLRRSNGERVTTLATMTALDGHKLFLFTDLTEQKRHEASDERTRRFLGMLAHEFRNILGPINNSVQYLKRVEPLDAEAKRAVELIERQSDRLLALVEDLRRINPKE
jgi:PAS domain S-box-containing protein